MQYTFLGNTGYRVSRLGFGAMRLPMINIGGKDFVDAERALALFHRAFELGVNYVDTGFMYCNYESEFVVGQAVAEWPKREEIIVTAKATKFHMSQPGDLRRMLEHQLWKQRRDSFDFYCFHGIGWDNWQEIDSRTGWIEDMARAKEEGLIKHCGFSFHDKPEAMKRLIDTGLFELVTCQYNYLDRSNEEVMYYASEKGLGVVVMGPVGGGRLATIPKGLREAKGLSTAKAAELALRFVLSHPAVDVAISGMSTLEMVEENCMAVDQGPLNAEEIQTINSLIDKNRSLIQLYCTDCRYCQPCPKGVNIPRCFELYNYYTVFGLEEYALREYRNLIRNHNDASVCVECNTCLERCPQHLEIPQRLQEINEFFARLGVT